MSAISRESDEAVRLLFIEGYLPNVRGLKGAIPIMMATVRLAVCGEPYGHHPDGAAGYTWSCAGSPTDTVPTTGGLPGV